MTIENGGLGTVSAGKLGGIRLDLAATIPAPHTISRTPALAALPSVTGGPCSDFIAAPESGSRRPPGQAIRAPRLEVFGHGADDGLSEHAHGSQPI